MMNGAPAVRPRHRQPRERQDEQEEDREGGGREEHARPKATAVERCAVPRPVATCGDSPGRSASARRSAVGLGIVERRQLRDRRRLVGDRREQRVLDRRREPGRVGLRRCGRAAAAPRSARGRSARASGRRASRPTPRARRSATRRPSRPRSRPAGGRRRRRGRRPPAMKASSSGSRGIADRGPLRRRQRRDPGVRRRRGRPRPSRRRPRAGASRRRCGEPRRAARRPRRASCAELVRDASSRVDAARSPPAPVIAAGVVAPARRSRARLAVAHRRRSPPARAREPRARRASRSTRAPPRLGVRLGARSVSSVRWSASLRRSSSRRRPPTGARPAPRPRPALRERSRASAARSDGPGEPLHRVAHTPILARPAAGTLHGFLPRLVSSLPGRDLPARPIQTEGRRNKGT